MRSITSKEALIANVLAQHKKTGTDLSDALFNMRVKMSQKGILEAFAECQFRINGDICLRIENKSIQKELAPEDFDRVYKGNCEKFLKSLNDDNRFRRFRNGESICFFM